MSGCRFVFLSLCVCHVINVSKRQIFIAPREGKSIFGAPSRKNIGSAFPPSALARTINTNWHHTVQNHQNHRCSVDVFSNSNNSFTWSWTADESCRYVHTSRDPKCDWTRTVSGLIEDCGWRNGRAGGLGCAQSGWTVQVHKHNLHSRLYVETQTHAAGNM